MLPSPGSRAVTMVNCQDVGILCCPTSAGFPEMALGLAQPSDGGLTNLNDNPYSIKDLTAEVG
jgi:hypothetical protein